MRPPDETTAPESTPLPWSETASKIGIGNLPPAERLKAFESWQTDVGNKLLKEGKLETPESIRKWKEFEIRQKRKLSDPFMVEPRDVSGDLSKWEGYLRAPISGVSEDESIAYNKVYSGRQPAARIKNKIVVDPSLIRNPDKYREAVINTDAPFDLKMQALAERPERETEHAITRRRELSNIIGPHSKEIVNSLQEGQEMFGIDFRDMSEETGLQKGEDGLWNIPSNTGSMGKNFLPLAAPARQPLKELSDYQKKWGVSDDEMKADYMEALKATAPTEANRWLWNKKDLETINPALKGETRIINQDIGAPEIAIPKAPDLIFKKDEYDKLVDSTVGASDEMKQRAKDQREAMARQMAPVLYNALLENRSDFREKYTGDVDKAKGTESPEKMRQALEKFYSDKKNEGTLDSIGEYFTQAGSGLQRGFYSLLAQPSAVAGLLGNKKAGDEAALAYKLNERSGLADRMAAPGGFTQFTADFAQIVPDLAVQVAMAIGTAGAANMLSVGKLAATTGASRAAATRALQIAARSGGSLADTTAMLGRAGLSEALAQPAISAFKELTSKNLIKGAAGRQILLQAGYSGISQASNTYANSLNRFREAGMSDDDAHQAARINGAVAGGITAFVTGAFSAAGHGGVEKIFSPADYTIRDLLKTGILGFRGIRDAGNRELIKRTAKTLLKDVGDEALEEGIDQFLQGIAAYATDPTKEAQDKTMSEVLDESVYASALGAAGGGMSTVRSIVQTTLPSGTTAQDVHDAEGFRAALRSISENQPPASAAIQGEVTAADVESAIDEKIKQAATTAAEVASSLSENEDTSKTAEALNAISAEITGNIEPENKQEPPVQSKVLTEFNEPDKFYRVVVGDEALDDILETGVVRTGGRVIQQEAGKVNLAGRPTAFPSFSKGSASISYAQNNPNNYIIETADPSIQPSTHGRHGKGTTYFPTDSNGNPLKSLSGEAVNVYKHIGNDQYVLVYSNGRKVQPGGNANLRASQETTVVEPESGVEPGNVSPTEQQTTQTNAQSESQADIREAIAPGISGESTAKIQEEVVDETEQNAPEQVAELATGGAERVSQPGELETGPATEVQTEAELVQSPESPPSESTPTEEVSPTEGDRYPSETVSGDSGSDVGQLSENIETPQQEEVNTGNTIEVPLNKLKKVTKKGSEFVKENTRMTREQAVLRVSTLQNTDKILSALRACVGKG